VIIVLFLIIGEILLIRFLAGRWDKSAYRWISAGTIIAGLILIAAYFAVSKLIEMAPMQHEMLKYIAKDLSGYFLGNVLTYSIVLFALGIVLIAAGIFIGKKKHQEAKKTIGRRKSNKSKIKRK